MTQLQLTQSLRKMSRDEMNLAEFPLTVLSTRANPSVKTLEFGDTVRSKNGEVISRRWIITGADKFGLPTASDDEVLLGLLKLTVSTSFESRKIYFTRYELLRILRWTTEGRSYRRLQRALDRLSGVRIKATNAFYDNESKSHSTRNFGLIDAYEINDGRNVEPKPSFFIWSEVLFRSFQAGFIKKLDLDFLLSLRSAVSKRLYRYLDKHFWYRSRYRIGLFTLAHEKIGISRNYRYCSSLRQQLDPAIEELIQAGFLSDCHYEGKGRESEVVFFAAAGKPRSQQRSISDGKSVEPLEPPVDEQLSIAVRIEQALVDRKLNGRQAHKLLEGASLERLKRITSIIEYFDQLVAAESRLVSRSPVGFLYRAVENPFQFVLPSDPQPEVKQAVLDLKARDRKIERPMVRQQKASPPETDSLRAQYLVWRKQEIERLKGSTEEHVVTKLEVETGESLGKLRGLISEDHFAEAIEHGVEERLAKLYRLADFEEWCAER